MVGKRSDSRFNNEDLEKIYEQLDYIGEQLAINNTDISKLHEKLFKRVNQIGDLLEDIAIAVPFLSGNADNLAALPKIQHAMEGLLVLEAHKQGVKLFRDRDGSLRIDTE